MQFFYTIQYNKPAYSARTTCDNLFNLSILYKRLNDVQIYVS